ncbi:fucose 4-O-acetylase-like acetyltransferase [Nocardioides sp. J9]|uniref:acyltransferase family protein n=1 Tax=unclassified Nocardioides TaxID=2615069 RepID=UPI0004AE42A6|nr:MULTISPECIES: acyltransferase family protein [unclassified Nocardioides]TWH00705.1 fucose 4-O-acetylase-like acetyltransferase [Nocardioides sp. J9]
MPAVRDPWLDNAKMGLIVLVVVGHTWALLPTDDTVAWHLYDFVYLWHMPAFIFLSGYLSRGFAYHPARMWKLVTDLLVPYVLFEGALGLFRLHVGGEDLQDLWLDPHFPMWYLLALAAWRLATPLLRPLPGAVLVAVGISLAGGFVQGAWTEYLDLPRILGFLPFFVLGLKATPESLEWLRGRFPALLGVVAFGIVAVLAVDLDRWASTEYLYYRPFDVVGDDGGEAVLARLGVLALGLVGTFAWLTLVPRVSGWFTRMGAATMIVYLFHGFAVKGLEYAGFRDAVAGSPALGLAAATGLGVAVALLLALPRVRGVLGHVADPFGLAHRRVGEAVDLAVVVQEHEAAQDAGPEPVERHEETGASR